MRAVMTREQSTVTFVVTFRPTVAGVDQRFRSDG